MEQLSRQDPQLENYQNQLQNAYYEIEDVLETIRDHNNSLEYDEKLLTQKEDRLGHLERLKSRYGKTLEEVLSLRDTYVEEVFAIKNREGIIKALKEQQGEAFAKTQNAAEALTQSRKTISQKMVSMAQNELQKLHLERTTFIVDFKEKPWDKEGGDQIRFLISTNQGESVKPLSQVASGGELSRILLGFKAMMSVKDPIPTYVFDEVEAGIGGQVIKAVGKMLHSLSSGRQILCITHNPQIAVFAKKHFYIKKIEENQRTFTQVVDLVSQEERYQEVARLINGNDTSKETLDLVNTLFLNRLEP